MAKKTASTPGTGGGNPGLGYVDMERGGDARREVPFKKFGVSADVNGTGQASPMEPSPRRKLPRRL